MGVRGLTTFIAKRSREYHEDYELHDSYLVIDGHSIACQLYKWHSKCIDCFGGDYDKYAQVVYKFFQLLKDCNVTPLVIFDGGYEKRKLKTIYERLRNRYESARDLNSVTEGRVGLFPLFLSHVFVDIVLKLSIKCVRCDFEADNDAANLARNLNCPILSFDSDFYIMDVLYIPFSNMELTVRRKNNFKYVPCQIYRVEKFLRSFGGLDKGNLPLLAVLLGNDYIPKRVFSVFYQGLKMQKSRYNEQQTQIKSVIMWLQKETPESALRKILGRYKIEQRRTIAKKIQKVIDGYQAGNTFLCSYFNIEENKTNHVKMLKVEDIQDIEEGEKEEGENDDSMSESEEEEEEEQQVNSSFVERYNKPKFFYESYQKCYYPACFIDMIVLNTYYCIAHIDDPVMQSSHTVSFDILSAIAKILHSPYVKEIACVTRNDHSQVQRYRIPIYKNSLPVLADIKDLDESRRKQILLEILNLDDAFSTFPDSWQIYLICMKYWITNSKNNVSQSYIFSLMLCGIILNFVDSKIGVHRSSSNFFNKYRNEVPVKKPATFPTDIKAAVTKIDSNNSLACMRKLIPYFEMDPKMRSQIKLFDKTIIHNFAEFQSITLHVKYLNSLLNFPFSPVLIADFYNGTFLYNMTTNLQKRSDLKNYMDVLLQSCPAILNVFSLMINVLEKETISEIGHHEPPKKRKKRKQKKSEKEEPSIVAENVSEEDEPCVFDANNKFSLLSFVNK